MRSKDLLTRIYELKVLVVAAGLVLGGLLLSTFADWLENELAGHLVTSLIRGLGDVLVVSGGIGLAIDFFIGREKAEAEVERTRSVVKELVPDFTDAVLRGLAVGQDDLRRVANPELLDDVATNALALRLGDEHFASEVYSRFLDQAIRTTERWEDVDVDVRLSRAQADGSAGTAGLNRRLVYSAVITWEYTVALSNRTRRFIATEDAEDFREILHDGPASSAWFIPQGIANATDRSTFELLSYSLDGVELPIRRTARKHGQTYVVDVGAEVVAGQVPVRVRQVYRTVVDRVGHRFRVSLAQPTHGLRLVLDYTDADIAVMKVGELVSSAKPAQVKFLPEGAPAKQVEVSVPGWLLPQAEVTFVWTLEGELPPPRRTAAHAPAGSAGR